MRILLPSDLISARIASQRSLSEMTLSQPIDANPSAATLNPVSAGSTLFLRPAPDRPSSIPGSSPRLAPSSSQSPSPSPSRQRSPVLVGASSRSGSVAGAPSGQELVEIPRFKKRELLLAIVGGHSLGPKIAWIGLWVAWLSNGLLSLVRLTFVCPADAGSSSM